jgi:hypothetical protein
MTRHIHAEVLARYRGGDLGERRSRRVQAHVAGCHRCAAASADLAEVSQLLRGATAPPMPADITVRIEAALAAEAAQPDRAVARDGRLAAGAAPGLSGTGRGGTGRGGVRPSAPGPGQRAPASGRARPGQRAGWPARNFPALHFPVALQSPVTLRVLAGTAVAAVIVGGAYTVGQLTGGSNASSASSAAAGPSARSSSDAPMVRPGASGAPETSPRSAGAGSAGVSGAAGSSTGPALTYQAAHGAATFVPVVTESDVGRQGLAGEVGDLLRSTRRVAPLGAPSGTSTPRFFSGIPVTALEGCVTRVAAGGKVRLVDVGRYQGSKATIIVVAPAGGGRQQIWVVGPGCSGSDPQVITRSTLPSAG